MKLSLQLANSKYCRAFGHGPVRAWRNGASSCSSARRCSARRMAAVSALRGVLCDLDGVMYEYGSQEALPGAVDTFLHFQQLGVPWLFVTNTTTATRDALSRRLRAMGIPASPEDILSPAKLAADWLCNNKAEPAALLVAPGVEEDFGGVQLLPAGSEGGAGAVVVGDMGAGWDYGALNRAFRLVMYGQQQGSTTAAGRRRVAIVSLGKGRYYKGSGGLFLDAGPFTAALEYATDQTAVVLGKPDPLIFQLASQRLGLQPHEVVMVGDDIRGDVAAAQSAGLRGLLVRTGKFRPSDLEPGVGVTPDGVLPSVGELPEWWAQQQQQQNGMRQC